MPGGFTLMEMLVALALFSVVVTIGSDLYLTFQRAARRTEALRAVLSDVRFVTERLTREAREGAIDYDAYAGGLTGPQSALHLRNAANQAVSFRLSDDCRANAARECIALQVDGGGLESLLSRGVRVRDLRFFIRPADNPFEFVPQPRSPDDLRAGQYASDLQPRVTVSLEVDNNFPENHREYIRYGVQTTISSRVYRR